MTLSPRAVSSGQSGTFSKSISPRAYDSPEWYKRELTSIFQSAWLCVGLTPDLAHHNDWLLRDIGGLSVTIHNFHGELRALHNVCSHRHSLIRTHDAGNGPLQCNYHGWTYDRDGCPVGIPGNNEHFCFDTDTRRERALASFDVATCGIFVFVRISPVGESLKDFLGSQWTTLQTLSSHFGELRPIDAAAVPWKTNWKIAVESVLEVYHVDTVHPETFKKLVKSFWRFEEAGVHSIAQSVLREDMIDWWDKAISRLGLAKVPEMDQYDHFMIFPNMAIGVTRGSLASVQTYEPTGVDSCTLRFRMLLANSDQPSKVGGLIWKSVAKTITDFNRALLEEDRIASENSQAGLAQAMRPAILGINEGRIRLFHESLAQYLDSTLLPSGVTANPVTGHV